MLYFPWIFNARYFRFFFCLASSESSCLAGLVSIHIWLLHSSNLWSIQMWLIALYGFMCGLHFLVKMPSSSQFWNVEQNTKVKKPAVISSHTWIFTHLKMITTHMLDRLMMLQTKHTLVFQPIAFPLSNQKWLVIMWARNLRWTFENPCIVSIDVCN